VVLEGRARIEAGGEIFELDAREALVVPAGVGHQVWNAGEGPLTFLVAAAPPTAADSAPA
jgi:mannose-6-phosphate isomerase-like protein (cupin superfamily)